MTPADPSLLGVALGLGIGFILGLLGGGGSMLAVPILLFVFGLPAKVAIATSLVIVGIGAASGSSRTCDRGTLDLRVALSFGVCAVAGTPVVRHLPQRRIKQGFAVMILVVGTYLIVSRL